MPDYVKVLKVLANSAKYLEIFQRLLQEEISMPNIPLKTAGGNIFWNTVAEHSGWKFQQNMLSHHARILNEKNIRVAWGTFRGMERAMKRLSQESGNAECLG